MRLDLRRSHALKRPNEERRVQDEERRVQDERSPGDEAYEAVRTDEIEPRHPLTPDSGAAAPSAARRASGASRLPPREPVPHQKTRHLKGLNRLAAPRKPPVSPAQRASSPRPFPESDPRMESMHQLHASSPRVEARIRIRAGNEQRPEPGAFTRLRPHAVDHCSPPSITEWRPSHLRVADSGQASRVRVAATRFEAIASCALGNGLRTQCPSMSS